MTATSYVTLDNDDLGANKIFRAATASALDTNPVSIAQRGTGAPWLNGIGAIAAITSSSGNWTVPTGVYRIKAIVIGSGGDLSASNATFGAMTANVGANGPVGAGGTASGGDINITGESGISTGTAVYTIARAGFWGGSIGCGSLNLVGSGGSGAGGTAIKCISVEPGDLIAYAVSGNGIIIIEY